MPTLVWDKVGDRVFENGVDHGVLYPNGGVGVAWNGIISVAEKPTGGDLSETYIDGDKARGSLGTENFAATLEAFTYPDEFALCDGTADLGKGLYVDSQPRIGFGLSYRTKIGNDVDGQDFAYKLHIVYNALASPSEKAYATMDDSPDAVSLSWDITTTPVLVQNRRASAHFIIDSRETDIYLLAALEEQLYGTGASQPTLPTANQLMTLFDQWQTLKVVDHGDGTWTASGPDPVVHFLDDTSFEISWHSANPNPDGSYTLSSG